MLLILCRQTGVEKGTMNHLNPVQKQCQSIICKPKLWTRFFLFAVELCTKLCVGLYYVFCLQHLIKGWSFTKCPLCLRQTAQEYIPAREEKKTQPQPKQRYFQSHDLSYSREKTDKNHDILKEHYNENQNLLISLPSC